MHSKHAPGNLFRANLSNVSATPIVIPQADKNGLNYTDLALNLNSSALNTFAGLSSGSLVLPENGFR